MSYYALLRNFPHELGHSISLFGRFANHRGGTFIAPEKCDVCMRQADAEGALHVSCKEDRFMKVKEIMTPNAKAIWLTESLADAAKLMWENDCGVLPIIKDGRKVIGMITDRDICMAVAMRDTNPSGVSVEEVMTGQVYSVNPEDDVNQALQAMQKHKIRRMPVVNPEGELEGMLSLNDIVLNAKSTDAAGSDSLDYVEVVKTYQAICRHAVPAEARSVAAM